VFRKILLATDGSVLAHKAVVHAYQLATLWRADILVVLVVPDRSQQRQLAASAPDGAAQLEVQRIAEELTSEEVGTVRTLLEPGHPEATILEVAEREGVDLIVMSTHGRSGVKRTVLGSVADQVARNARCPVLLVRATNPDEEPE
jgi:nucleotide-binding universal stress UspA family protein